MIFLSCLTMSIIACSLTEESRINSLRGEGETYFARRQYAEAINAWEEALRINPDQPGIYHQTGIAYLRLSNFSRAKSAFQKAIGLNPQLWAAHINLVKIELVSFDLDRAEKDINRILTAIPDNPETHVTHGDLLFLQNRFDKAATAYRKALELGHDHGKTLIKLAECLLAKGDKAGADSLYNTVLSFKSNDPETFIESGNYCRLTGNMQQAEEHFRRAANLEPENLSYQGRLASLLSETGQYDNALAILNNILRIRPNNLTTKKAIIEILLTQSRLEDAHAILKDIHSASDVEINLLKGKYHLLNRDAVHAIGCFQAAVESEPNLPVGHYLSGIAHLAGNHIHLAQQSFLHALMLDPCFSEANLALADIYYKEGEYDLSLEYATRVSGVEPANYRAHMIAGNILLRQREYESAIIKFNAAQRIHPEATAPRYYLALAYELSNQTRNALTLYQRILSKNNKPADVALRYARLSAKAEEADKAEKFCLDNIASNQIREYFYHILGEVHLLEKKPGKAAIDFRQAIAANPRMMSSYIRLEQIPAEQEKPDGLIALYEKALEEMPDISDVYNRLATLYIRTNRSEKAFKLYERVLSRHPDSALAANNLAWLCLKDDQNVDKALLLAQSAYNHLPDNPCIKDTLGWAYYKKNLIKSAVWHLRAAENLMPDNRLVQYHLGMALHSNNQDGQSRDCLEKALALNLENPYREKAENLLATLTQQGSRP